ncbi:MAG: N-6 DNA methylase [Hungatella hathewayi]|nr:N-6 DNA methylase [Hungatella hathewayi]
MREQLREFIVPILMQQIQGINDMEIEDALIRIYEGESDESSSENETFIRNKLLEMNLELDEELLTYLFELLLEKENKVENGIVFTPKYIADFMCKGIWENVEKWNRSFKVLDPGCGAGIFLVSAVLYISDRYQLAVGDVIKHHIYGIDLDDGNVRRCKKLLMAMARKRGETVAEKEIHLIQADSLKEEWNQLFGVKDFQYIIGNPPYVNTHDMSKETSQFLKENFITTKTGVYNIFYAFIEHAMKYLAQEGELSYIVPNNFLSIRAAADLRDFLKKKACIKAIIDFGQNMVFKPVRTYSCIVTLDNHRNERVRYHVMEKVESIQEMLPHIVYDEIEIEHLDKNGWNLVDHATRINLNKIEKQVHPIKEYIRTGIATLRDGFYMVEQDAGGFYKMIEEIRYCIEPDLVKKIYKIPELSSCNSINEVARYIIFPYRKGRQGYEIIPENELKEQYHGTYQYLSAIKEELDKRDKGKGNPVAWYAYGRTQGLNKFGRKLLFPTFAYKPKFMLVEEEDALFCNGYGIFENDFLALEELMAVLNSTVMRYYVSHTSYMIEGGYYCYQKKYIERFSIPDFNEEEKGILRCGDKEKIDTFLIEKYGLTNVKGRAYDVLYG